MVVENRDRVSPEVFLDKKDTENMETLHAWGEGFSSVIDGRLLFKVRGISQISGEEKIDVDVVKRRKGELRDDYFDKMDSQMILINLSTYVKNTVGCEGENIPILEGPEDAPSHILDFKFSEGKPIRLQIKYP